MSPEVLARKLVHLRRCLQDLRAHEGATVDEIEGDPYAVERLLELVVQIAVDLVSHELSRLDVVAASYRDAFRKAGEHGGLSEGLATRLQDAAGLRNVLVHMYDDIDYGIVARSIGPALEDFGEVLRVFEQRLAAMDG